MLDIPQLLRKVDVIVVRIFKPLDLIPLEIYLLTAVRLYLGDRFAFVDTFSTDKYRLLKFFDPVIRECFFFPRIDRIEYRQRL